MKKFLSLFAALVMLLSMTITAAQAAKAGDETSKNTLDPVQPPKSIFQVYTDMTGVDGGFTDKTSGTPNTAPTYYKIEAGHKYHIRAYCNTLPENIEQDEELGAWQFHVRYPTYVRADDSSYISATIYTGQTPIPRPVVSTLMHWTT